eukprot:TRINITY_DN54844_c0_g1_i2.p1 TRINITY_DN54844_c0_g1~~TRINITY_DN54844_c0_g1_i2.p1  ORF type:complete len:298 (-),score=32.27 TRINITY_DN54844_c0_g1_i2:72-965(-)
MVVLTLLHSGTRQVRFNWSPLIQHFNQSMWNFIGKADIIVMNVGLHHNKYGWTDKHEKALQTLFSETIPERLSDDQLLFWRGGTPVAHGFGFTNVRKLDETAQTMATKYKINVIPLMNFTKDWGGTHPSYEYVDVHVQAMFNIIANTNFKCVQKSTQLPLDKTYPFLVSKHNSMHSTMQSRANRTGARARPSSKSQSRPVNGSVKRPEAEPQPEPKPEPDPNVEGQQGVSEVITENQVGEPNTAQPSPPHEVRSENTNTAKVVQAVEPEESFSSNLVEILLLSCVAVLLYNTKRGKR